MSNTGYKAMLRDRVPYVVNLALKWCNCKERWINHVYEKYVGIYVSNTDRKDATRIVLGIKKHNRQFNFHKTIDWENLSSIEYTEWSTIEKWVNWFCINYLYIKDIYDSDAKKGCISDNTKERIKKYISTSVHPELLDKLVTFLITNLNYE